MIATATKYIEGTLEQTVLQPACCQDPFSSLSCTPRGFEVTYESIETG